MKRNIFKSLGILIIFSLLLSACNKVTLEVDAPRCIKTMISNSEKGKAGYDIQQVWKWEVDGNTYYHTVMGCCDQFNYLYDEKCNEVCAPDGGLNGMGNGECPTFSEEPTKTLIWKKSQA